MIQQVTEFGITYNHATGDYFFVVYNTEKIITVIDSSEENVVDTMQSILEFETLEDAEAWIASSGLTYTPESKEEEVDDVID